MILLRWGLASLALLVTIYLVPGIHRSGGALRLLVAVLAIGLLNLLARPVVWLMRVLTLPLSCLTLGLWSLLLGFFVNVLVFYFVGTLGWGFRVDGFWAAALGALVMSVISAILNVLLRPVRQAQGRPSA
jgi:putative membrane protein